METMPAARPLETPVPTRAAGQRGLFFFGPAAPPPPFEAVLSGGVRAPAASRSPSFRFRSVRPAKCRPVSPAPFCR